MKLHRMAKVHDFLDMWDGSQKLRRMQQEARAQNSEMTAMGYISDTDEMVDAGWESFKHDGATAFKVIEQNSGLPTSLPHSELLHGKTKVLKVRQNSSMMVP